MQFKWKRITKRTSLMLLACVFIISLTQSSTILIAQTDTSQNVSNTISYVDRGPIIINNDADLFAIQTGGDGSEGNPYLISNFNITSLNNDGIYVTGTTEYFRIENNLIEVSDTGIEIDAIPAGTAVVTQNIVVSSDIGIQILSTPNILISLNNCTANSNQGIYLDDSPYCEVLDNTCNNNWWGIGIYNSNNCTVNYNTASSNNYGMEFDTSESAWIEENTVTSNINEGIYLNNPCHYATFLNNNCSNNFIGISVDDSNEVVVIRNECASNSGEGLYIIRSHYALATHNSLSLSDTGLFLGFANNGTFSNNIITNNNLGIYAQATESNEYHNNLFQDNSGYGLQLDLHCFYISVHHNAFIDNGGSSSQAYDDGWRNDFYDTDLLEGNYWSDFVSGTYSIDGMGGNDDLYPLGSIPVISEFLKTSSITLLILMFSSIAVISIFRKK